MLYKDYVNSDSHGKDLNYPPLLPIPPALECTMPGRRLARRCCAAALPIFAGTCSAYDNGVAEKPPLGWNTWCTMGTCGQNGSTPGLHPLHDVCTEGEIKSVAEAMLSSGLHELGYVHINLDDCWIAEDRTADGAITWSTSRFPSGIPSLTAWLHAKGLKFGLYSSMGTT
eukprot:gene48686-48894_t